MNIQIIGTKRCNETKKALRFFSERGIPAQFRDIGDKPLSEGELRNIAAQVRPEELIDTGSAAYKNGGFAWKEFDPVEEILADNRLLKTPVIRADKKIRAGFDSALYT
jgi:arsenate reductase-like glutaredoxin family protein